MSTKMTTLGQRIAIARKSHKPLITQGELAKRTGMTQANISQIEIGKYSETPKIVEIANALNVNIHWLQSGKGLMQNQNSELRRQIERLEKILENMELGESEVESIIDNAILYASKINIKK